MTQPSTDMHRPRRRTQRDAYELEITVRSPRGLDLYNQGVECLLGFGEAAARRFEEAVQIEANFALAHGMRGVCHYLEERVAEARTAIDTAQRHSGHLVATAPGTSAERWALVVSVGAGSDGAPHRW